MQLGSSSSLLWLAAVEVLALGFVLLGMWRRRASARFGGERAASSGSAGYWARATLVVIAASLAVIAMARPQWGSKQFSRQHEGVDVVIALDISQSMTATDVQPTRLGLAQSELSRLLDGMRGNRAGLVFFAGTSFLRSPLSTDMQALSEIVNRADKEPGLTRAGSDIGAALDQAGRILDASKSPGKAVIVVSDGEDFGSSAATEASQLASKGVVIFAAGIGTPEGSTLQDPVGTRGQTRTKVDAAGRPVITRLNEGALQTLAGTGGGRYLRLTGSGPGLLSFRDDLNRLEQAPLSEQTQRVPVERMQLFVAAALMVLVAAWFLPERLPRIAWARLPKLKPRPGLALLLVSLVIGGACAGDDPLRSQNEAANKLFEQGDYQGALQGYQKLLAERPDLPELAYNTGNALNKLGDYERAIQETRRALPPATVELGAATYFALGNHYLGLNDLLNAFEAYKNALLLDPNDADAKWNLELVLFRMNGDQVPLPGQPQPAGNQPGEQAPPGGEEGMNQPGETPQSSNSGQTPQPGGDQPQTPPANPADIQRQLQEALAGLNQDFSFEDAIQVLDLLRQLNEQQRQAPGGNQQTGPDY